MKISRIETFLIPGDPRPNAWCSRIPYVFVRLETSCGVVGWGEGYTFTYRERVLVAMIQALAEHLIGAEVSQTRSVLDIALNGFGEQQTGSDVIAAASAIEIAMWDTLGKVLDAPVLNLIGGPVRDRIDLYANIWTKKPHDAGDIARHAANQIDAGFKAIKMYPYRLGETVAEGAAKVRAVRDAIGPDAGLAIDIWRFPDVDLALEICRSLEPFGITWIEDPFDPRETKAYVKLASRTDLPLVTGETLNTGGGFAPLLDTGAVSLINPDVCAAGGILEMYSIAGAAQNKSVRVSPHNYNSMTVGLAATVTVAFGIPNLGLVEYFPEGDDDLDAFCTGRMRPVNGQLAVPIAPGLGIEFHDAAMDQFKVATQ